MHHTIIAEGKTGEVEDCDLRDNPLYSSHENHASGSPQHQKPPNAATDDAESELQNNPLYISQESQEGISNLGTSPLHDTRGLLYKNVLPKGKRAKHSSKENGKGSQMVDDGQPDADIDKTDLYNNPVYSSQAHQSSQPTPHGVVNTVPRQLYAKAKPKAGRTKANAEAENHCYQDPNQMDEPANEEQYSAIDDNGELIDCPVYEGSDNHQAGQSDNVVLVDCQVYESSDNLQTGQSENVVLVDCPLYEGSDIPQGGQSDNGVLVDCPLYEGSDGPNPGQVDTGTATSDGFYYSVEETVK